MLDLITPLRRTLSEYRRKNSSSGSGCGSSHGVSGTRGFSAGGGGGSAHDSGSSSSANGVGGGSGGDGGRKASASSSLSRHGSGRPNGGGGGVRRPANGKAPGRRDPEAVARLEAAAKLAAEEIDLEDCDPSWRLPTNVDYYTDRGEGSGLWGAGAGVARFCFLRFFCVFYVSCVFCISCLFFAGIAL